MWYSTFDCTRQNVFLCLKICCWVHQWKNFHHDRSNCFSEPELWYGLSFSRSCIFQSLIFFCPSFFQVLQIHRPRIVIRIGGEARAEILFSWGADRGPRAPPLWLNSMHILLYPRIWTAEKIMLTEKKFGIHSAYQPFVYGDPHSTRLKNFWG